jgi:hypothetical protein
MRSSLLMVVLLASPAAHADDEEATVAVEAGAALVHVGHGYGGNERTTVPGGGGTLRAAYGLSDLVTVEAAVGGMLALNAEHRGIMVTEAAGNVFQDVLAVRVTGGAALRFGARVIPTLSLHGGYQHRRLMNAVLFDDSNHWRADLAGASEHELVALAAAGVELRLDRHWHVGVNARAVYALGGRSGFLSVEVPLRLSYAWYPGLFRSRRVTRFED